MAQTAFHNARGMTLIEIMISMLIMTVVAVAMMQSSLLVMNTNLQNELRDEAVSVAELRMNEGRNTPFDDLASLPATTTVYRNVRSVIGFPYTADLATQLINTNSAQVSVDVTWTYRGASYKHSVSTVLRNE